MSHVTLILGKLWNGHNKPTTHTADKITAWSARHGVDEKERCWHVVSDRGKIGCLIDTFDYPQQCPASDKRYKMLRPFGQDAQVISLDYHTVEAFSALDNRRVCPGCLANIHKAAKMLEAKGELQMCALPSDKPSPSDFVIIDTDKPLVVDSATGAIQQAEEKTTIKAAKELATKLVQQYDRPFTVCVPHTTLAPQERPVKEIKHDKAQRG